MPIIKSAIKRARQSATRRSRNLQTKRAVKADILSVHAAIAAGNDVSAQLAAAYSEIDRAVKKKTIHKNTAARRKGQLAAAVNKASGTTAVVEKATTKGAGTSATKKTTTKKAVAKAPVAKKAPAKKPATKKTTE
jgi:ribosomal protein S20